jgi:hypothetical protein
MRAYIRDSDQYLHSVPSHALKNVGPLPHVRVVTSKLTTLPHTDFTDINMTSPSNDNCVDSTVCALVKQAIVLEKNYKEMLHQGNEVNLRIKLWRGAVEICKSNSKSMSLIPI